MPAAVLAASCFLLLPADHLPGGAPLLNPAVHLPGMQPFPLRLFQVYLRNSHLVPLHRLLQLKSDIAQLRSAAEDAGGSEGMRVSKLGELLKTPPYTRLRRALRITVSRQMLSVAGGG